MKKILMNSIKKCVVAFVSIIIAILIAIWQGMTWLESFCFNNPKISSILILTLCGALFCFLLLLFFIHGEFLKVINKDKIKGSKLKSNYKPFVLVFDDEVETLKDIDECLAKECQTVLLSDMTHESLADRFDIIIGDIGNIGYGYNHKNASSILNEIIRNDPYKLVIMITNDVSQAKEIDPRIKVVSKDSQNEYLRLLLREVKTFRSRIIDLGKYWDDWKKENDMKGQAKETKRIKEKLYNHFKEHIEL